VCPILCPPSLEFFPTPGVIRKQVSGAQARGFELETETEWQKLLTWVRDNVYPVLVSVRAPHSFRHQSGMQPKLLAVCISLNRPHSNNSSLQGRIF